MGLLYSVRKLFHRKLKVESKREAAIAERDQRITLRSLKRVGDDGELAWRVTSAEAEFRVLDMSHTFMIPPNTRAVVVSADRVLESITGPCEHRFQQRLGDLVGSGTDRWLVIMDAGRFTIDVNLACQSSDGQEVRVTLSPDFVIHDLFRFYRDVIRDRPSVNRSEIAASLETVIASDIREWVRSRRAGDIHSDENVRRDAAFYASGLVARFAEVHGLISDPSFRCEFRVPRLEQIDSASGRIDLSERTAELRERIRGVRNEDEVAGLSAEDRLNSARAGFRSAEKDRNTDDQIGDIDRTVRIDKRVVTAGAELDRERLRAEFASDLESTVHQNTIKETKLRGVEVEDEFHRSRAVRDARAKADVARTKIDLAFEARERKDELDRKRAAHTQLLEIERARVMQTLDADIRLSMMNVAPSDIAALEKLNRHAKLSPEQLTLVLAVERPDLVRVLLAQAEQKGEIESARAGVLREYLADAVAQRDRTLNASDARSEQIVDSVREIGVAEAEAKRKPEQRVTNVVQGPKNAHIDGTSTVS